MEPQEAVVAYRAHIVQFYERAVPRPTDEWIADLVNRLWPVEGDAADGTDLADHEAA